MKCISDKKLVTNLGLGIYTLPFENLFMLSVAGKGTIIKNQAPAWLSFSHVLCNQQNLVILVFRAPIPSNEINSFSDLKTMNSNEFSVPVSIRGFLQPVGCPYNIS
jgi:hypothetical protein